MIRHNNNDNKLSSMIILSPKYRNIVAGVLMGWVMSLVTSFTMAAVNIGFSSNFIVAWIEGFVIGLLVAIPTSLIVGPIIRKVIKWTL